MHTDSPKEYDVVICGAGPAGLTAALAMGHSEWRVAVIDKAVFPREKVCGDAVAAYIPKVLRSIHSDYAKAFDDLKEKRAVNVCKVVSSSGQELNIPSEEPGYIIERLVFDDFLLKQVSKLKNVDVFFHQKVTDIQIVGERALVKTDVGQSFQSSLVLGCDGAQGVTAKMLAPFKQDPAHYSAAVRSYFTGVKDVVPTTFELHFMKQFLPGYFWIFPMADGRTNVGLGVPKAVVSKQKLNLREEMLRVIQEDPVMKKRFEGATMTKDIQGFGLPLGSQKVKLSGSRFMLCGDAGSLIDPLTGEGIGQAMISGRYAGWHALHCLKANDFSAQMMAGYDAQVYGKLWRDQRRRYRMQQLIQHHPVIFNALVDVAGKYKWFFNLVMKFI